MRAQPVYGALGDVSRAAAGRRRARLPRGALQSSLVIDPDTPRFSVRGGYATAGGGVGWGWFERCGTGVNVRFTPSTGRFEGTFLGISVAWGSDQWRA